MNKDEMLSVVIVEDSVFYADLILRILKRDGYKVESRVVTTETAFQDALNEASWDIILSDNALPGFSALKALRLRNGTCGGTPFVIVSEDIGHRELAEAFDKGCSFFLAKDRITELPDVIRNVMTDNDLKQNCR